MPYRLQPQPDQQFAYRSGSIATPVATLKDEAGSVVHIVIDDHCYCLVVMSSTGGKMSSHWFLEAVQALRGMPDPS